MSVAIIITLGTLSLAGIIAVFASFASDRGESHFDHMLRLYHERKLAK
jgi:hypothetical protein